MKKIVIITAVTFAAVAAQAQSPRVEVSIAETGFKGLSSRAKVSSQKATSLDTLQNAIERQVAKYVTGEQTPKTTQPAAKASPKKKASSKAAKVTPKTEVKKSSFAVLDIQAYPSVQPYK